jgi:hypothetical protein
MPLLLIDPEWQPDGDQEAPDEAVVGMWPDEEGGRLGRFRPNPDYQPRYENSPVDPLDAALRLVVHGEVEPDQVAELLRTSMLEVALNGDGRLLLSRAADDVLCAMVATSPAYRFPAPDWGTVSLEELLGLLPDDADVLFNADGPAWTRLSGDFLREAVA